MSRSIRRVLAVAATLSVTVFGAVESAAAAEPTVPVGVIVVPASEQVVDGEVVASQGPSFAGAEASWADETATTVSTDGTVTTDHRTAGSTSSVAAVAPFAGVIDVVAGS